MSRVYAHPHYYALAYRWNTDEECDFIEECVRRWQPSARQVLDIGCGAGRHVLELAARDYDATGIDPEPAMIDYAREQAAYRGLTARFETGALENVSVDGPFDIALCLMDTFRFLLTDDAIIKHLRAVGERLTPGGIYILDFWVPRTDALPPAERYDWEQRSETTHVRVDYAQYADSWDPVSRTFEDELTFTVSDDGESSVIAGGRTRTRLLLPEELDALIAQAGGWQVLGHYDGFSLAKPRTSQPTSWRMVTVLQRAPAR